MKCNKSGAGVSTWQKDVLLKLTLNEFKLIHSLWFPLHFIHSLNYAFIFDFFGHRGCQWLISILWQKEIYNRFMQKYFNKFIKHKIINYGRPLKKPHINVMLENLKEINPF